MGFAFFLLALFICFSTTMTANVALHKPVIVSSNDFVANCNDCCYCRNDNGKLNWNDGYTYWDQLEALKAEIIKLESGHDAYKVTFEEKTSYPKAWTVYMELCKMIIKLGKPKSTLGSPPTYEHKATEAEWEDLCTEYIKAGQDKAKKDKFYDHDYLQSCRFRDGEMAVTMLTDGAKMDPAKNTDINRREEVKKTCFKSKWQKNPWILVDLENEVDVGKVKIYNRLEALGYWEVGNYPVYPDLKKMPKIENPPWVWDRLDRFQVFVFQDATKRWRTWAKNKRQEKTFPAFLKNGKDFKYTVDIPFDFWEIGMEELSPGYVANADGGTIPGATMCGGTHEFDKWKKEFNEEGAHSKTPWIDFAAKNYPFTVDCAGSKGRYVLVRLLNTGRTEDEARNYVNGAPMSICEVEVETA